MGSTACPELRRTVTRRTESSTPPGPPATTDRAVVERLVSENMGWLRGYVRGRLGDPESIHDVCQETFLKAIRALPRLEDLSTFPAWLYRIAENTIRDHVRQRKRQRGKVIFTDQLDELRAAPDGENAAESRELAERLLDAIRALPVRYRDPLLLRHSRDLPYSQIGAILGISEKAVQVRIFRARKMLAKRLEPRSKGA
jgi:RNA polymerase sigma factor (sigma-70 family)